MVTNIRRTGVLGKQSFQRDAERIRANMTTSGGGGAGSDHGALTGLSDDDHSQYAHLSQAETVLGQWDYAPASPQAPFTLGANAQGQLVTGLNADELDGYGTVSDDPGATEAILKTDSSGILILEQLDATTLNVTTLDVTSVDSDLVPLLVDTYDLGSSTKLWRTGYLSELEALLFVENSIHVEGGWLIVGYDQGTLDANVGSGDSTIDFGKVMALNDFVLMRGFLQVEYVQVGTLVSGTEYNVTRDLDGSGANNWPQGAVFLVLGNTGDGRIELVANQTDSPRISILEQGATYNAQTERVRIGNMRGSFGVGSNDYYGFGAGDYSGGDYIKYNNIDGFILAAGGDQIRLSDAGIELIEDDAWTGTNILQWVTSFGGSQVGRIGAGQTVTGTTRNELSILVAAAPTESAPNINLISDESSGSSITIFGGDYINISSSTVINEDLIVEYGLRVGDTTGPTIYDIRALRDIACGRGLWVGDVDGNPTTQDLYVDNDGRFGGGVYIGSTAVNPTPDDLIVEGQIFVSETTNVQQTNGLTVKSSAVGGFSGNEYIALKNSAITHGMTTLTETDTFFTVHELLDNRGGAILTGFTDPTATTDPRGLMLIGVGGTQNNTTSTSAQGAVVVQGSRASGTGRTSISTGYNLVVWSNHGTARMILDGDGTLLIDHKSTRGVNDTYVRYYDDYDDIKLLTGARALALPTEDDLRKGFDEFIDYARPVLEASRTIVVNDGQYGNDNDGSVFMNVQGMLMLTIDTIRQMHDRILQLEARNENHN